MRKGRGTSATADPYLLVKAEWDEIEGWLTRYPDERYRRQHSIPPGTPIGNY